MPHIRWMGYLLTLLVGAALVIVKVWTPAPPPRYVGMAGGDVPRVLGNYQAPQDDPIPADVKTALASANLLSRTYQQGSEAINFVLIGGTDRSALHDPRSCLIGSGMQLENDHLEPLLGTGSRGQDVEARACRAVGQPGETGYDILYLYIINGKVVNEVTQIRVAMLWSALLGRQGAPVYFLRFTRDLSPDPQAEALGHAHLQQFATEMWTKLQPKLLPSTG